MSADFNSGIDRSLHTSIVFMSLATGFAISGGCLVGLGLILPNAMTVLELGMTMMFVGFAFLVTWTSFVLLVRYGLVTDGGLKIRPVSDC